jgi:hypothetical protein
VRHLPGIVEGIYNSRRELSRINSQSCLSSQAIKVHGILGSLAMGSNGKCMGPCAETGVRHCVRGMADPQRPLHVFFEIVKKWCVAICITSLTLI